MSNPRQPHGANGQYVPSGVPPELCQFDGCDFAAAVLGYCASHYAQYLHRGRDESRLTPVRRKGETSMISRPCANGCGAMVTRYPSQMKARDVFCSRGCEGELKTRRAAESKARRRCKFRDEDGHRCGRPVLYPQVGLCSGHYRQQRLGQELKPIENRTMYLPRGAGKLPWYPPYWTWCRSAGRHARRLGLDVDRRVCTLDEYREHMEQLFADGMSWDNHGNHGWHNDHVIPRHALDRPEDWERCWALSNLRPMWGRKNIGKSDRIVLWDGTNAERCEVIALPAGLTIDRARSLLLAATP